MQALGISGTTSVCSDHQAIARVMQNGQRELPCKREFGLQVSSLPIWATGFALVELFGWLEVVTRQGGQEKENGRGSLGIFEVSRVYRTCVQPP